MHKKDSFKVLNINNINHAHWKLEFAKSKKNMIKKLVICLAPI